jgi:hypothetical protein
VRGLCAGGGDSALAGLLLVRVELRMLAGRDMGGWEDATAIGVKVCLKFDLPFDALTVAVIEDIYISR